MKARNRRSRIPLPFNSWDSQEPTKFTPSVLTCFRGFSSELEPVRRLVWELHTDQKGKHGHLRWPCSPRFSEVELQRKLDWLNWLRFLPGSCSCVIASLFS